MGSTRGVSVRRRLGTIALLAAVVATVPSVSGAAATAPLYMATIGGPGHAQMYPSGLDVDAAGNVYVADTGNGQIAAYAPNGTQIWRIGARGPISLSEFVNPRDVAYLNGILYVADTGNGRVVELGAADGAPITAWTGFGSIMGIHAGVDGTGSPIILVTQDQKNNVQILTPSGSYVRTIGFGPGPANGQLTSPRDAATDSSGNIYVADFGNSRIAKFSPHGTWSMNWGSLGTAKGLFRQPYGVAVDDQDGVYVADSNNWRVQKFDSNGVFLGQWGKQGTGPGAFFQLRRVAVGHGASPDVYAADLWAYKIDRFSQAGSYQQTFGGVPPPSGLFNEPSGISLDRAGNIFVADAINQRFEKYSLAGNFETEWGERGWGANLSGVNWPRDVAFNAATNTVWVADTLASRLIEYTTSGTPTGRVIGGVGSATGQFHWPLGLTALGSDLVVADTVNNRVQRISTRTGTATWSVGGFQMPNDVAVAGRIVYVSDASNHRIVMLNAANGSTAATIGDSTVLHSVQGLTVDANGHIWVADTTWSRILELANDGTVIVNFGSFGGAAGQFNHPTKLQIANGRLYVDDQWNDKVQVFQVSS